MDKDAADAFIEKLLKTNVEGDPWLSVNEDGSFTINSLSAYMKAPIYTPSILQHISLILFLSEQSAIKIFQALTLSLPKAKAIASALPIRNLSTSQPLLQRFSRTTTQSIPSLRASIKLT
jgi:hypothetical protein